MAGTAGSSGASGRPPVVTPVTPDQLAARIAALAGAVPDGGAPAVRLGIDGAVEADADALADAVAAALRAAAVPVARVRARDFLRPRSLRFEHGRDDPDAFHDLWYDTAALRREVLDPLGPGGGGRWLPRLRDPDTDRAVRIAAEPAAPGTVLVLDGRFLLRDDLRPGLDRVVHLDVSPAARLRRVPVQEAARVLPAWERYLAEAAPRGSAHLVVRHDHPDRPAVLERS